MTYKEDTPAGFCNTCKQARIYQDGLPVCVNCSTNSPNSGKVVSGEDPGAEAFDKNGQLKPEFLKTKVRRGRPPKQTTQPSVIPASLIPHLVSFIDGLSIPNLSFKEIKEILDFQESIKELMK